MSIIKAYAPGEEPGHLQQGVPLAIELWKQLGLTSQQRLSVAFTLYINFVGATDIGEDELVEAFKEALRSNREARKRVVQ